MAGAWPPRAVAAPASPGVPRGARVLEPLTHHEIMALVAPFTAAGLQLDLPASERSLRRLVFKPLTHPADADTGLPTLVQTLRLDNPGGGPDWLLLRSLALPDGEVATLQCEGPDAAALLAAVQAVPASRQLRGVQGLQLVFSHRLVAESGRLVLTGAATRVAGLRLSASVSRVKGIPAELEIVAPPGDLLQLPEDLFAVQGLAWSRLQRSGAAWRCSVRLRGFDAERTRDAELRFATAAAHLSRTLAEPPLLFHRRFLRARWLVVLRRLTPLLMALALIVAAALVPQLPLGPDSVLRMLIFNAPPLLLVLLFSMRELPRIEIPPLPRPPAAPRWRRVGPTPLSED